MNPVPERYPSEVFDFSVKQAMPVQPFHHFCSVIERPDIEEKMHSSVLAVHDSGLRLDGRRAVCKLVQVVALGHGRWVQGGRQPAEVAVDQLVYVNERTVAFRLHLRKQNHFFVAMDSIMAELDPVNLKLRPVGQFVVTREIDQFIDDRVRRAVMGDTGILMGQTTGIDKDGLEADDIGCNKTRIEEVVAVGPGKFGGFKPDWEQQKMVPYWETVDCKVGDLVVFTDMARPKRVVLAGKSYTLFEFDHAVCGVLDRAV